MPEPRIESGQTYVPFAIIANPIEALAYRAAQSRDAAGNTAIADRLNADLARAAEQAGDNMDLSQVQGFGDDPGERIMEVHSQLSGIERAVYEALQAEARERTAAEDIEMGNAARMGRGGGVTGQESATVNRGLEHALGYIDRMVAAARERAGEDADNVFNAARRGGQFQYQDALPQGLRSHEIRAAVFQTTSWDPFYTREPGYVPSARRPLQILDIMPMSMTNTDTVAYMLETHYGPAADGVAEGATAPEARFEIQEQTEAVKRIRHRVPVTEDILADEGQTRGYLETVMPFGVMQVTDAQILTGAGDATDLGGILGKAGVQQRAFGKVSAGDTTVTKPFHGIKQAKTQVRVTGRAMPTHCILHPEFWDEICLAETESGGFYLGRPSEEFAPRVWGMPVVENDNLSFAASGNMGLISDLTGMFTTLYVREGVMTEMGTMGDQFGQWTVTIRSGWRGALVIRRPASHCRLVKSA